MIELYDRLYSKNKTTTVHPGNEPGVNYVTFVSSLRNPDGPEAAEEIRLLRLHRERLVEAVDLLLTYYDAEAIAAGKLALEVVRLAETNS